MSGKACLTIWPRPAARDGSGASGYRCSSFFGAHICPRRRADKQTQGAARLCVLAAVDCCDYVLCSSLSHISGGLDLITRLAARYLVEKL